MKRFLNNNIEDFIRVNRFPVIVGLLLLNFIIRIIIYYNTKLFYFSDYSAYLNGIDNIAEGEKQYLLIGNFLFTISYIGYFAKYILGNIDYFFIFNCLLGTLSSLVIYFLIVKVTGLPIAGVLTIIIHTLYTESMVFSSVFYTPVLMIFLLSLFLMFIYLYLESKNRVRSVITLLSALLFFFLTFFFKPELKYLPWFLLIPGLFFLRRNKFLLKKILLLAFLLLTSYFLLQYSGLITHPKGNVISNSFVFFGHTGYGGDGGEGTFVYPENRARYETALKEYCETNNIVHPGIIDYNAFHRQEIKKFITQHPVKWAGLQFTKFFRTFGVVPESTSFKVLYTGLLKDKLWLTAIVVVAPVVLIILMFIIFFNFSTFQLFNSSTSVLRPDIRKSGFLYIYLLFFIYYLIAAIFYGQYQERYQMPLMVVFIIPALSFFMASFNKEQFLKRSSLIIKSAVIVLFLAVWVFQTKKTISNKARFDNAIRSVKNVI